MSSIIERALEAYAESLAQDVEGLNQRIDILLMEKRADDGERNYLLGQLDGRQHSIDALREEVAFEQAKQRSLQADIDHLGTRLMEAFDWSQVAGLDKIPAIKFVREFSGMGLKFSKDAVDAAERDGRWVNPRDRTMAEMVIDACKTVNGITFTDTSDEEAENPFLA